MFMVMKEHVISERKLLIDVFCCGHLIIVGQHRGRQQRVRRYTDNFNQFIVGFGVFMGFAANKKTM